MLLQLAFAQCFTFCFVTFSGLEFLRFFRCFFGCDGLDIGGEEICTREGASSENVPRDPGKNINSDARTKTDDDVMLDDEVNYFVLFLARLRIRSKARSLLLADAVSLCGGVASPKNPA